LGATIGLAFLEKFRVAHAGESVRSVCSLKNVP
jgi:hypothetical protein